MCSRHWSALFKKQVLPRLMRPDPTGRPTLGHERSIGSGCSDLSDFAFEIESLLDGRLGELGDECYKRSASALALTHTSERNEEYSMARRTASKELRGSEYKFD